MQTEQVISILESVAAGVDPDSGEPIPNTVFHSATVIRAFYTAATILRQSSPARGVSVPAEGASTLTERPAAAGARWSKDEDAQLCTEYDSGMAIHEIATGHGRTRGAITSRLVKLGRIDSDTVKVRDRTRLAS